MNFVPMPKIKEKESIFSSLFRVDKAILCMIIYWIISCTLLFVFSIVFCPAVLDQNRHVIHYFGVATHQLRITELAKITEMFQLCIIMSNLCPYYIPWTPAHNSFIPFTSSTLQLGNANHCFLFIYFLLDFIRKMKTWIESSPNHPYCGKTLIF